MKFFFAHRPTLKAAGLFLGLGLSFAQAQDENASDDLRDILKARDALIFEISFDTCETERLPEVVAENFEFYHDQGGTMLSREAFIENTENGLCRLSYDASRVLLEDSVEIFPLKNNGEIYGAIQSGVHQFYARGEGGEAHLTSTARFTHLWLLEEGKWKLARVLSFDHQSPEE